MNEINAVEHAHGDESHVHAWGGTSHDHLLRALCGRSECWNMTSHNIHRGPGDLTRIRNAQLRILLTDAAMALREAQLSASWLCTEENMRLLADIDQALDARPW